MNALYKSLYFLFVELAAKTSNHCFSTIGHTIYIVKHTYFSLFYQIKAPLNTINSYLSISENNDLTTHIISGLSIVYKDTSKLLVYPVFTLLFFSLLAIVIGLATFTIKKYIQCEMLLSAKLFILTILASLALVDIYLIAFGKTDILILFLRVQKDIFFILLACLIGLWAGKIYFQGSTKDDVLP